MDEREWLADRFEEHRAHLRAVAYRLLGSPSEAEGAVQDAWLRLSRADRSDVENLGGWLTTVVARVCLNRLQARTCWRIAAMSEAHSRSSTNPTCFDLNSLQFIDDPIPAATVLAGRPPP